MIPDDIKALEVKVKPNSKKNSIVEIKGDKATIEISAKPEDGKANKELEKFLSNLTGRNAIVKSGFTSKRKLVVFEPRQ